MLGQDQLARLSFPVGDLTKDQTRRMAARLGIRTAHKPDSQDICFVGQGNYRQFLAGQGVVPTQGPIIHQDGRLLGVHHGITNFTIGQRRGLGVAVGEPLYVTDIDPDAGIVTVGDRSGLEVDEATVENMSWVDRPVAGDLLAQYRAHGRAVPVEVSQEDELAIVHFAEPQEALARGQTLALYLDEEVVGGGIIRTTA